MSIPKYKRKREDTEPECSKLHGTMRRQTTLQKENPARVESGSGQACVRAILATSFVSLGSVPGVRLKATSVRREDSIVADVMRRTRPTTQDHHRTRLTIRR